VIELFYDVGSPYAYLAVALGPVPTARVGEALYRGDDRLEEIAGVI
jgi:2-hydroxychromene-2-carboxylate isomerase